MGVRLPTILGKAIEDTTRTLNEKSSEEEIVDLVKCIHRMDVLMDDLSSNAKLRPILDDAEADVALWNKEIAKYFQGDLQLPLGYQSSYTINFYQARIS
jgi:damage-control phosphatase, subfamily III